MTDDTNASAPPYDEPWLVANLPRVRAMALVLAQDEAALAAMLTAAGSVVPTIEAELRAALEEGAIHFAEVARLMWQAADRLQRCAEGHTQLLSLSARSAATSADPPLTN